MPYFKKEVSHEDSIGGNTFFIERKDLVIIEYLLKNVLINVCIQQIFMGHQL